MRMSSFWAFVLWIGFFVILFAVSLWSNINLDRPSFGWIFGCIIGGLGFFFSMMILNDRLEDVLNYRYRITKDKWDYYQAKRLRSGFLFIPYWTAVETTFHSYKTQNIFGAKSKSYFSSEKEFKSKEKALEAIDNCKEFSAEQRKEFFKRPEKEVKNIVYKSK